MSIFTLSNAASSLGEVGGALEVIDFHCHFAGAGVSVDASRGTPPAQKAFWDGVTRRLSHEGDLIASMREAGVSGRVINTSLEFVCEPGGSVNASAVCRMNDALAEVTSRYPNALFGLATVDAYGGEASAVELTRAVKQLRLKGVFVESAKGDLLPDAAEARPTFQAAAELGVPVFLHPVPDAALRKKFRSAGKFAERLSRSAINSAAVLAMADSGMFENMPQLNVVVTALAVGGLMVGECLSDGARIGPGAAPRRNVYIDTTGMHSTMLRAAVDLVGADHVVTGTDWPVVTETDLPGRLGRLFSDCGLTLEAQRMIAAGNARKLLRV